MYETLKKYLKTFVLNSFCSKTHIWNEHLKSTKMFGNLSNMYHLLHEYSLVAEYDNIM
jgi:hypothetical protein